jgi:hypothetical protein
MVFVNWSEVAKKLVGSMEKSILTGEDEGVWGIGYLKL